PDAVGRGARAGRHRRLRRARCRGHQSGVQVHPSRRVRSVPKEGRAERKEGRRPPWILPIIRRHAATEGVRAAPRHHEERMKDFGQDDLIAAQNTSGIGPVERVAIRRLKELSANGLEKLMKEHQLDAIVTPGSDASSLLATGGHPGIIVPAGFNEQGVPFGICFGGLQGYEPRLIEMAYAFEQATKVRKPPMFKP
uniref:Amidase domain-containing protein n=1 Tax=Aegilops tauschii subsp. strangulata TaxID=200361 RepID=A0A453A9W0_AEGTS